jgi:hypothetical protein
LLVISLNILIFLLGPKRTNINLLNCILFFCYHALNLIYFVLLFCYSLSCTSFIFLLAFLLTFLHWNLIGRQAFSTRVSGVYRGTDQLHPPNPSNSTILGYFPCNCERFQGEVFTASLRDKSHGWTYSERYHPVLCICWRETESTLPEHTVLKGNLLFRMI